MFADFVNEILVPALIKAIADIIKDIILCIDWKNVLELILHMLGV